MNTNATNSYHLYALVYWYLIRMIFTFIGIAVLWCILDWMFFGSSWSHRVVFSKMNPGIWSGPSIGETINHAERRAVVRSTLLTFFSAFFFTVLGEWVGAHSFDRYSALLFIGLFWCAFIAPIFLFDRLYLTVGTRYTLLQLVSWLAKIALGIGLFLLRS